MRHTCHGKERHLALSSDECLGFIRDDGWFITE